MRDLTEVKDALKNHQIELPSWAFGNSGTRFKVFGQPGVPRNPYEKADDAAQVHKYTGVAPIMAVHIPWDKVDDYAALSAHAHGNGIKIGAVNANVFQDDDYKLGSICNPDPRVRKKALAHLLECVDIMDATGSRDLKLWFADGTNYSGQPKEITAPGAAAQASGPGIAFMLDQCHNIEPKIPAQIRSVMNVQEAVAKALLVDAGALREAQLAGDVLAANAVLMDAYNTDVRPLLGELREEMGLARDPVRAYLASGYAEKIVSERVG